MVSISVPCGSFPRPTGVRRVGGRGGGWGWEMGLDLCLPWSLPESIWLPPGWPLTKSIVKSAPYYRRAGIHAAARLHPLLYYSERLTWGLLEDPLITHSRHPAVLCSDLVTQRWIVGLRQIKHRSLLPTLGLTFPFLGAAERPRRLAQQVKLFPKSFGFVQGVHPVEEPGEGVLKDEGAHLPAAWSWWSRSWRTFCRSGAAAASRCRHNSTEAESGRSRGGSARACKDGGAEDFRMCFHSVAL